MCLANGDNLSVGVIKNTHFKVGEEKEMVACPVCDGWSSFSFVSRWEVGFPGSLAIFDITRYRMILSCTRKEDANISRQAVTYVSCIARVVLGCDSFHPRN